MDYLRKENEPFLDWIEKLIKYGESKEYDIWWDDIHELVVGYRLSPTESRKRCYLLRDLLPILKLENLNSIDIDKVLDERQENTKIKSVSGEEDVPRVTFEDFGDYYIVSSNKRSIEVAKEKVKNIKKFYCGDDSLTINQMCRKLNIPRRDFMLIKNAFNITHDDVPYIDEELNNIDTLVEDTLERKKEKYFVKLQQKEIKKLKEEVNKYRDKDYLYDKVLDALCDVRINRINFKVRDYAPSRKHGLLDLADWHVGLFVNNYWNTYNSKEMKARTRILTERVIEIGRFQNIEVLHVSSLGDMIAGIIHDSIRVEAEIDVTEQVKKVVEALGSMLISFAESFKKVIFADVNGNHGRIIPSKSSSTDKENLENFIGWGLRLMLSEFENIEFEDNFYDDGIISKEILGHVIFETHGHNDKFNKVAGDLTMMIQKPLEIHMAHYHHNKAEEFHDVEVSICKSFSGVDAHSKNLRLTNKAGQRLYIYNEEGRECVYDIILN